MAYDGPGVLHGRTRGGVVLFGGYAGSGWAGLGDTWLFLHGQWRDLPVALSPPMCSGMAYAYDGADGRIVVQGGQSGLSFWGIDYGIETDLNDTWAFSVS